MIWGGDPYSSKNWFFSNLVENYLKTREGWRLGTDLLKVSAELADLHRTFIFGYAVLWQGADLTAQNGQKHHRS